MKKVVLITIAVLLIGGMTLAVGYGSRQMKRVQDVAACETFVDEDGDGINDNCPVDGEKVYMNRRAQAGNEEATRAMQRVQDPTTCENFVDANEDGINDNCPNGGERLMENKSAQDGTGYRYGASGEKGPGRGKGFGKTR
ncbi:MAG: Thrombospondin type 3 repeat protein [Mesotoga sp.]|jgi:predicted RNA-binding Zn-ribbon protein involved in translation (DUF1610 family)|uniref:Thrombospondin type 3 repeat protein n=1 Tax=unclassified Mesotoga TaxID=1184398 RepID=UPI000EF22970|nr:MULTISPECIES: Thrombospondin type 3 repeat protein [unclassified Mesotoga]MDD2333847.1 Thrombospondin type 3 repeat protein [Mesotoga sp.]MDD3682063.1 Thrombospondin type 3 repeat protein [Mesotoga sp.]MDD4208314.1 Thrombospondin type 3 repeat protein [Mesotoga sp.]MDD5683813.1 Thrombospondin type 3 repeat protein [Mesotoga sp.]RLL82928.1 Thrombospondin type 3 repeat protein [Mesotoga sp. BH458_6_3_2_1]